MGKEDDEYYEDIMNEDEDNEDEFDAFDENELDPDADVYGDW